MELHVERLLRASRRAKLAAVHREGADGSVGGVVLKTRTSRKKGAADCRQKRFLQKNSL